MIRHAKKEDADSCIHLFDAISEDYSAYKNDSFYEELHQGIERREVFVSLDDDELEGFVMFDRSKKELTMLAVHPKHRNQGVATKLIYTVAGCFEPEDEISVITFAESDPRGEAARACYRSCGFEPEEDLNISNVECQKLVYRV